jgi:alpha-L-fucosidase
MTKIPDDVKTLRKVGEMIQSNAPLPQAKATVSKPVKKITKPVKKISKPIKKTIKPVKGTVKRRKNPKRSGQKPARKPRPNRSFEHRFSDDLKQTPDSVARVDKWFRDAKFGAFVHFGVYSSLAGEYKGRGSERRYSEWIQMSAKIPAKEYHQEVASKFNPSEFDADEWAQVFKDAGMRYVVITSKHHDGFALFKSTVSSYNIVDATEFKRDIIKELSEACRRKGLKFGVYYSNAQDWDEPDAPFLTKKFKASDLHPDLPADFKPDMDRYIEKKSLPQVEELVKNYELDLIWFDTPAGMTYERAERFRDMVRKYRPDCLINSRIIYKGKAKIEQKNLPLFDYVSIGDKEVPTRKLPVYFECPDSVSSSFGYKKHGKFLYHPEKDLINRLVRTVCSGGNYLLNNGPMGNGKLDPQAVKLYQAIGKWMKVNGESLLDTRSNPLPKRPTWGDVSVSKTGDVLYLHILKWPKDGKITLNEMPGKVSKAIYLANGKDANFEQKGSTLSIALPKKPVNEYDTVIKVTLAKSMSKAHLFILSGQSNMVGLNPNISFTPTVEAAFGKDNVIIVKDAAGGQPIRRWYKKWKPAEGDEPKATGDLYNRLMTKVNAAIEGREIQTVTFVWMQGERDAKGGQGQVYETSLKGLIAQLRADMGRKDINFVIGRLSDNLMKNPGWITVRKAQVAVAQADPRGEWVNTDDLNDGKNRRGKEVTNDLHYSVKGYKTLGKRFAEKAIELINKKS